jgi:hypothetical protein
MPQHTKYCELLRVYAACCLASLPWQQQQPLLYSSIKPLAVEASGGCWALPIMDMISCVMFVSVGVEVG